MDRKALIHHQIDSLMKELDKLNSLPSEPEVEPGPTVIQWNTDFGNDRGPIYSYAAINTPKGWYTTGPLSPKEYTWLELIKWITDTAIPVGDIWVATGWEVL